MNSREEAVSHREYWDEASRPLAGLVLLAPLLLIYEWHAACQDSSAVITLRNGVDIWLRTQMGWLGFDHEWCVPALVLLTLAGRHILSCQDWNIRPSVIGGMMAEAALFAALLVILGQLIPWSSANIPQFPQEMELLHSREALLLSENTVGNIAGKLATPVADAWPNPSPRLHWVTCLGAGIYEEFLFRLGLIPVLYGLVRMLGIPRVITLVIAIGASSLLFAAAHYLQVDLETGRISLLATADYIIQHRDVWSAFSFRCLAGSLFGALLVFRGIGIAAGCHIGYDLFVGYWMG
ncbi:Abortive infection protein [Planctopirus limnophila DSM 3776]|uniref:Abortive infection protein n=1 Tax=Planctopirus limnophila (strain ATCC 43296 / DSM 3776 / IFAM 1008 / Mu 290) TaxID=521674 RepID=D5SUU1_PLAL2|nr:CPBP family intramembrane glutamic endopeptidase [Planctopirus limnophila]ADG67143.1 Abortive infection protein [Planctopirus limnophila DSM 3776]